ncbi:twin-arginine translocation signal domain-containing protein [Halorubrum sp. ASP1]|jgi:hypothetical protein|uniref:twin-arginine translocation signal domain-containing protein n=1 Tax=Halorubrum sp. ASP1 TaxID=2518114 RepID=UPI0010F93E02|nr:twin-arginine translocation signal domain-containing protein [Halorubrum sp. ASP1]TKX59802.1 twin-arginine translocation signal domain-containing protein [Halorubrum sp. ASP1]
MEEPDSDPDFDEEQYQNELNDAVDDGGGCAETWEALSQARRSENINRRKILKTAGLATAVGVFGLPGKVSAEGDGDDPPADELAFVLLDKKETNQLRADALKDDRIKQLAKELRDRGFTPKYNEVVGRTIDIESEDPAAKGVLLPFEADNKYKTGFISWYDDESTPSAAIIQSVTSTLPEFDEIVTEESQSGELARKKIDKLEAIDNEQDLLFLSEEGAEESDEFDVEGPAVIDLETDSVLVDDSSETDNLEEVGSQSISCVTNCTGRLQGGVCVLGCAECFVPTPGSLITCLGCLVCSAVGACCVGQCSDRNGILCTYARTLGWLQPGAAFLRRGCARKSCNI